MMNSVSLALFKQGWAHNEARHGRELLTQLFFGGGAGGVNVSQMVVGNQDGSGNFTNITAAVAAAPTYSNGSNGYFVIYVVAGVYQEYVTITKHQTYLMMIGDGINQTIITGNHNVADGWTTFNSATFGQSNTITAQGKTDINQNTGTSIHNCSITAAQDLASSNGTTQTFLGRPWKLYSTVVYMQSFMDSLINPAGWAPWSGDFALNTSYYAEYNNYGPGSNTSNRVTWLGYHVIGATDAVNFTISSTARSFNADFFALIPIPKPTGYTSQSDKM
ncbi:putative pectinesterase/pectinesterase inhibitor 20 [Camellia lanceoleosa]|uniref:Pectinesterase/pectinesterase inhibitor 20 n=1 Tax=Camellia lanceoleosa TaxID=1840588 RepID=A0ACC0ICS9_9ERIC|nr:putative pectinesterase/pectinesterase inhibitor 20 [Camellia lanceoleosa]